MRRGDISLTYLTDPRRAPGRIRWLWSELWSQKPLEAIDYKTGEVNGVTPILISVAQAEASAARAF